MPLNRTPPTINIFDENIDLNASQSNTNTTNMATNLNQSTSTVGPPGGEIHRVSIKPV